MQLTRRDLLKLGVFSSAALALPAERMARTQLAIDDRIAAGRLPQPFTVPFAVPPVATPVATTADTDLYSLTQVQAPAAILPGLTTQIWGYDGIAPGPTIVVPQGRKTVVRQACDLPAVHPTLRYNVWTSTHLHGSASLPEYDGYASDITSPGEFKDYQYPNAQSARTLWYHDHGVHITAQNAYMGLAAMYILHDPQELALPIPHGAYDVPIVLKDAMFTSSGELIFDDNDHSGFFGDVILVNGRPWPAMAVQRRKYRFRILNASASRSYDLALSTGEPFTVIGTDGGLMPVPQQAPTIRQGMAERYEVVIDFEKYVIGQRIVLQNLGLPNNVDFDTTGVVMAFDVVGDAADTSNNEVPSELNPANECMSLTPAQATVTRQMEFKREGGEWTINGETWEDVINSGFTRTVANPALGAVEIWELKNNSGGWFHPVHIHLIDFQILDRNGQPPMAFERGPKDVAYVGEGETVRVLMKFGPHVGRYMMHCHNLVHEDHDMMVQFEVGADGHDPIDADRPRKQPAPELRGDDRRSRPGSDSSGPGGGSPADGSEAVGTPAPSAGPGPAGAPAPPPGTRLVGSARRTPTPKRRRVVRKKPKPRPRPKHRAKPHRPKAHRRGRRRGRRRS
jgi:FtsP/CotA-like multicopper oxidase with cupredoxin domain